VLLQSERMRKKDCDLLPPFVPSVNRFHIYIFFAKNQKAEEPRELFKKKDRWV
jgi:hypothetical protein